MVLTDMLTEFGKAWQYCPRVVLRRFSKILEDEFGFGMLLISLVHNLKFQDVIELISIYTYISPGMEKKHGPQLIGPLTALQQQ
ncbi:hypothetical protein RDI58_001018 [Solanum bulbocastanum]|uniref:Uncharacterized protein n=1 Tax=Solanum bulbocastanum TaxID=147425 RepID=A0AAN8YPP5_SOLBU